MRRLNRGDIEEFGGDLIIEVVTEEREGVVLYKDYNFIDNDKKNGFQAPAGREREAHDSHGIIRIL